MNDMNYDSEDVKKRSAGLDSDHGSADASMLEGESEKAPPSEQEIEELFETIEKKRKKRVLLGVLSLSISFGLFASVNFLMAGLLDITITAGWVLLLLSVILFALGLYLLVYHPIIGLEEKEVEIIEDEEVMREKFTTISGGEYVGGKY
jgi:hypothetical protein